MTTASDNSTDYADPASALQITDSMMLSLAQTKPWALFLSILGFISACFLAVMGGLNMVGFSYINKEVSVLPFFIIGIINLVMGVVYFFPALYLYKFASSIGRFIDGGGTIEMEKALSSQKSFWKFAGILAIISFGFAVMGIVAAIVIPLLANFLI